MHLQVCYFGQKTKLLFSRFLEFEYFFAVKKKLNENLVNEFLT